MKQLLIRYCLFFVFLYSCHPLGYDPCVNGTIPREENDKEVDLEFTKPNLNSISEKFKFVYLKPLGKGVFAKVHLVQMLKPWAKKVALKERLKAEGCNTSEDMSIRSFYNEANTLKLANHPRIPQVYYSSQDYILMDHIDGLTLKRFFLHSKTINKSNKLLQNTLNIGLQLIAIVRYLHEEAEITHGDIHSGNILINEDEHVSLIDFGDAQGRTSNMSYNFENLKRSDVLSVSSIISQLLASDKGGYYTWVPESLKTVLDKPFMSDSKENIDYAKDFEQDLKDFVRDHLPNE